MAGQFAVVSSVAYKDVSAAAVSRQIQAESHYVDIAVSAEATFPDRLVVDVVAPDDFLEKEVGKVFGDGVPVADVVILEALKALSDYATPTDELRFDHSKELADAAAALDAVELLADKAIQNYVTPYDTLSFEPGITLMNNQVFMVDGMTLQIGLNLSDAVSVTDLLVATRQFDRDFFDSVAATELLSLTTSRPLSDSVAPSDQLSLEGQKAISDSVQATEDLSSVVGKPSTDTASVSDVLVTINSFVRDYSDSVAASDVLTRGVAKGLSDAATPSDSLSITLVPGGALNTVVLNALTLN